MSWKLSWGLSFLLFGVSDGHIFFDFSNYCPYVSVTQLIHNHHLWGGRTTDQEILSKILCLKWSQILCLKWSQILCLKWSQTLCLKWFTITTCGAGGQRIRTDPLANCLVIGHQRINSEATFCSNWTRALYILYVHTLHIVFVYFLFQLNKGTLHILYVYICRRGGWTL